MATKTKEKVSEDPNADLKERIEKHREEGRKWNEIADALDISIGKAMTLYDEIKVAPKDRVANATAADVVRLRSEGLSWGVIRARCGVTEGVARKMFEEGGGGSSLGNRIGKGGRYPNGVERPPSTNGTKAAKATKATKATKAAPKGEPPQVVTDLIAAGDDVEKVRDLIDGYAIKVGTERIDVAAVRGVKAGVAVMVKDNTTGKARTVKISTITARSAKKVVKATA